MSADMQPMPENIDGSVSYSHEIHHKINWGYVSIGIAVIAALLFLREKSTQTEDKGVSVQ
jgi:hypothetical protein